MFQLLPNDPKLPDVGLRATETAPSTNAGSGRRRSATKASLSLFARSSSRSSHEHIEHVSTEGETKHRLKSDECTHGMYNEPQA